MEVHLYPVNNFGKPILLVQAVSQSSCLDGLKSADPPCDVPSGKEEVKVSYLTNEVKLGWGTLSLGS